jgi:hypothetical protein
LVLLDQFYLLNWIFDEYQKLVVGTKNQKLVVVLKLTAIAYQKLVVVLKITAIAILGHTL